MASSTNILLRDSDPSLYRVRLAFDKIDQLMRSILEAAMKQDRKISTQFQSIFEISKNTPLVADAAKSLPDLACLEMWGAVYDILVIKQTPTAQSSVNEILNLAEEALDNFKTGECQQEIRQKKNSLTLYTSINHRLQTLSRFNNIFSDTGVPERKNHRFYTLFDTFRKEERSMAQLDKTVRETPARVKTRSKHHHRHIFSMIGTLGFICFSTVTFFVFAWSKFKKDQGSKDDPDFWLLLFPIMFMQLHNLVISGVESLWKRPKKRHIPLWPEHVIWSLGFVTLGLAVAAPWVFVRNSKRYGQVLSLLATVGQAFMVSALTMYEDDELRKDVSV